MDPVEQMSERVFLTGLAGFESLSMALGDRLGFYTALDSAPVVRGVGAVFRVRPL